MKKSTKRGSHQAVVEVTEAEACTLDIMALMANSCHLKNSLTSCFSDSNLSEVPRDKDLDNKEIRSSSRGVSELVMMREEILTLQC